MIKLYNKIFSRLIFEEFKMIRICFKNIYTYILYFLISLFFVSQFISCSSGAVKGTSSTHSFISIAPVNPTIHIGTSTQFAAIEFYSDGSQKDVTNQVTWSTSNSNMASINSSGLATGIAPGTINITASLNEVQSTVLATISSAQLQSISITSINPIIHLGITQQFTATGIYTDGSQNITNSVQWTSSNTSVVTIGSLFSPNSERLGGTPGLVTPIAAGNATIIAQFTGVTIKKGSSTITVSSASLQSILVTPTNMTMHNDTNQQFTAIAVYGDGNQNITNLVTWSSNNSNVVVSNTANKIGLVSVNNLAIGNATITATLSGTTITPGSTLISISNATLSSIQVNGKQTTHFDPVSNIGVNQQYSAIGIYSDNSTQDLTQSVFWNTSNSLIAQITNNQFGNPGLLSPLSAGLVQITASLGSITGSLGLNVISAVLNSIVISPSGTINSPVGVINQFTAIGIYSDQTAESLTNTVNWNAYNQNTVIASSNAVISNAFGTNGQVVGVVPNTTATIVASLGNVSSIGSTFIITNAIMTGIYIQPFNVTLAKGIIQQFTATGIFSDNSTQNLTNLCTWTSSNPSVATINTNGTLGLATINATSGSTTITATYNNLNASTTINAAPIQLTNILITPSNQNSFIIAGGTIQYAATGVYSDGSSQNLTSSVTWASTSSNVASINVNGIATPLATGVTNITATLSGITGTTALSVGHYLIASSTSTTPILNYSTNYLTGLVNFNSSFTATNGGGGVVISPTGQYAYIFSFSPPNAGSFSAYSVNSIGQLTFLGSTIPTNSTTPLQGVYVATNTGNNYLYVTNETLTASTNGIIGVAINSNGTIGSQVSFTSPGAPYIESFDITSLTINGITYLYVATSNAGVAGQIFSYSVNPSNGALNAINNVGSSGNLVNGVIGANPTGSSNYFIYSLNQTSNTITLSQINPATGALGAFGNSISSGGTSPTYGVANPSGTCLFVGNVNGAVSAFSINPSTGILTSQGAILTSAPVYRLAFPSSGNYLYANANGFLYTFSINANCGLTLLQTTVQSQIVSSYGLAIY